MGQRQSEIIKNHMEVYWHDYASASKGVPITEAGLVEKASVIGRTGLMLLECGTGAWRVRSSMNTFRGSWESQQQRISACCPLSSPALTVTSVIPSHSV